MFPWELNSHSLIMGEIFSTQLELFYIRSSSNLSLKRTGVSLGRVRFPDIPGYSFGSYLPLSAEDLSHRLIMGKCCEYYSAFVFNRIFVGR